MEDFNNILRNADAHLEQEFHHSVLQTLRAQNKTVAVAESLTGGLVSARFTELPGSSAVFLGGTVCYSNLAKVMMAGADPNVIAKKGVVSRETALELAKGIRTRLKSDIGIGITGVAGPEPLGNIQPGIVHLAIAAEDFLLHKGLAFDGGREQIRNSAVQAVFLFLKLELENRSILASDAQNMDLNSVKNY